MLRCCAPGRRGGARLRASREPGPWLLGPAPSGGVAAAVQARSGRTIEECEADAVAGKFPAPQPFARQLATEDTPEIRPLDLTKRPRRNRRSPALREAFQETRITPGPRLISSSRCSSTKVKRTLPLELCLARAS